MDMMRQRSSNGPPGTSIGSQDIHGLPGQEAYGHILRLGMIIVGNDMSYFDLGPYSRTVTTSSSDAQLWFDRGLNWIFGFNHGEAIKCFQKALKHDPVCAMAHWGISYASGPNYNRSEERRVGKECEEMGWTTNEE